MVIIFLDLSGSTEQMFQHGALETAEQFQATLDSWLSVIQRSDPSVKFIKNTGDGLLLTGENLPHIVRVVVQNRSVPPARIAIGLGHPQELDGDIRGSIVNLTARLLSAIAPATVAVTEGVYEELIDLPELRKLLFHRRGEFKGFGEVGYWVTEQRSNDMNGNSRNSRNGRTKVLLAIACFIAVGGVWVLALRTAFIQNHRGERLTALEVKVDRIEQDLRDIKEELRGRR